MDELIRLTVLGLVVGAAYAIAASGLVITYATSNVFNMAHGAIGMVMAFVYWSLAFNTDRPFWLPSMPAPVAALLTVFVIAPLFGLFLERVIMRKLTTATVTQQVTVTVGLMIFLIGFAQSVWPSAGRGVQSFFGTRSVGVGTVNVSFDQLLTFFIAFAVAGGMYLLLNTTRTGIGMRAIVDNRTLLQLHGAKPGQLAGISWAIGSGLAALAGILLVNQNEVGLEYFLLTFLVINAFAAAMFGRLKSLPQTFGGALVVGLAIQYFVYVTGFLPDDFKADFNTLLSGLRAALPTIVLFVVMLVLPMEKLRIGALDGATLARLPSRRNYLIGSGAFLAICMFLINVVLDNAQVSAFGGGIAFALIMLSLVVLTGYGGDVSLGQMTFVGLGALVVGRYFGAFNLWSVIMAGVVAGLIGAIVAFPALRLRGLYLGLGTLAFAKAMEKLVFEYDGLGFSLGGSAEASRPSLVSTEAGFAMLVAVAFIAMAGFVLELRRSRYGRLLLATRDSPAACGTLGLNIRNTRVLVFALSAAMAGVGGAFFAGMRVAVGATDFLAFQSLPLLLMAAVGGITSVSGALLGGMMLGFGPSLQESFGSDFAGFWIIQDAAGVQYMSIGVLAIYVGQNPNGAMGLIFNAFRKNFMKADTVSGLAALEDGGRTSDVDAEAEEPSLATV